MNRAGLLLGLALLGAPAARAADAPPWLVEAAAIPTPADVGAAVAVVLLHERETTVGADGLIRVTERRAVRVLTREGVAECVGEVPYLTDGGRVLDLRGWLIRVSGEVVRVGKNETFDLSAGDDLYSEARVRVLQGRDAAEPGVVFGWEGAREEPLPFITFHWQFQEKLPVVRSRFSLTLPPGYRSKSWTFNHVPIEPWSADGRQTWELRDLAPIEAEPFRPPASSLAARLAVSVMGGASAAGRSFESWADVASWLEALTSPSGQPSAEVTARARALVAGAGSRIDSVRAIAGFVQGIRYASIQMGVSTGSGYRPHLPHEVLARSYGDCKDKSNLMRAMLRSVGIASHLVVVYAFDPDYVREEWATPEQFNHCIIGVELGPASAAGTDVAGAVGDGPSGKLLFFDPTDSHTCLGDLPRSEQGGAVLVVSSATRGLARLPQLPPEASLLERRAEVAIAADGSVRGTLREDSRGQAAATERALLRSRSRDDYRRDLERWIGSGMGGVQLGSVAPTDDSLGGRFTLDVTFRAPRYGQIVQDRLMLFRPAMVSRRGGSAQKESPRRYPVALEAEATRETVLVTLPEGFAPEELPKPVRLESPFGAYTAACEVRDGMLLYTRSLSVRRTRAPAEQYAEVRKFFDLIRAAEQNPVVLARR